MFTGIIRHVGTVSSAQSAGGGMKLAIDLGPLAQGLNPGDSVAVNGACLTATEIRDSTANFDVITETVSQTTLSSLRPGSKVNLERSLTAGDALDGHLVQGHIDGIATVRNIRRGKEPVIEFSAEANLTNRMVPKGSVTIDGVSLTLVEVADRKFSVALIPTTLDETTLGELSIGDKVNVETDVIGKYVLKYLEQLAGPKKGNLSLEKLREAGFL